MNIKHAVESLIRKPCPACGGVGTQTWITGFSDESGYAREKRLCEKCNGTGYVLYLAPQLRRAAELLICVLGSLAVYAFLGWQETVVVLLALIMIDMKMLQQAMEK